MPRPFTLYPTSLFKYENCPQSFLWGRGWGAIDLGGGPGRRKPKPKKRSEHHAIMGIALEAAIEMFYNNEEWKHLPGMMERLIDKAQREFDYQVTKKYVDWTETNREEMWDTIESGIRGYMRTLKANRFLGPYARAEVDMQAFINKYCPIGGRADRIIRRDDTGITILDGKNSKRYKDGKGGLMTFTDPDQLRFYALVFLLQNNKMVDRLGFTYYRFPYGDIMLDANGDPVMDPDTGKPKIEQGVEWVPFTRDDLKGLAHRAVEARRGMDKEHFPANPTPKGCKFCDYLTVCPERQAQIVANRRTKKKADTLADDEYGIQKTGW